MTRMGGFERGRFEYIEFTNGNDESGAQYPAYESRVAE